jgi:sugar phosphate isomerase/epimerase
MLGISTSWLSGKSDDANEIIRQITLVGVTSIELEYRIGSSTYAKMLPLLKKHEVSVSSVHNFFPVPPILERGSGDAFSFTSDDEDERKLAIQYTKNTMQRASELEAQVIVMHLGGVPLENDIDRLYRLYDQNKYGSEDAILLKKKLISEREGKAGKYLDRVLLCLDRLLPSAGRLGVTLGIENRYHYHEIPSFKEVGKILNEFRGAPIAYWHDTGHAHNIESLGFVAGGAYLDAYAAEMAGIHLHDARKREDHFAPGSGDIDFSAIKPYLSDEPIKIIEVHPKVKSDELRKSLGFLRALGIS